jgi:hypothetical protein
LLFSSSFSPRNNNNTLAPSYFEQVVLISTTYLPLNQTTPQTAITMHFKLVSLALAALVASAAATNGYTISAALIVLSEY